MGTTNIKAEGASAATEPLAIIVMGVSGSGKTTIAALLAQRLGWDFQDGDWFHPKANVKKMHAGEALTDDDRRPWLEAIAEWLDETVKRGGHGVVACSALKHAYRDILLKGDHAGDVAVLFLDGSRELIARRISGRHDHFMPQSLLDSQFSALERPEPYEHVVTVQVDGTAHEIVETAMARLGLKPKRAA